VSAGPFSMITNSQYISTGAIGALNEYTHSMFGNTPSGSEAYFKHANILIGSLGKKEACKVMKEYYRVSSLLACDLPFQVDQTGTWIS